MKAKRKSYYREAVVGALFFIAVMTTAIGFEIVELNQNLQEIQNTQLSVGKINIPKLNIKTDSFNFELENFTLENVTIKMKDLNDISVPNIQ